jgi:hypothetical protein
LARIYYNLCPCGEMDITLGFGPRISGSNPDEGKKNYALLAQLVEQIPLKDMVGGSNPSQGKIRIPREQNFYFAKIL